MKRLIIVGSPRSDGRSGHLAEMLFEANIDERPEDELYLVPVSEVEIGPCIGCGACRQKTEVIFKGDDGGEVSELRHRCVFDDDMQTLYDLLDEVDELTVVSPVYFSGAPAPLKCVLDRMQPYFWVNQRGRDLIDDPLPAPKGKRPATLHVVGEGEDPHGFDPLVGEVKSALACAGFRLERVMNWVGKIDEDGEILAEAEEVALTAPASLSAEDREEARDSQPGAQADGRAQGGGATSKPRPKLDLSASKPSSKSAGKASGKASGKGQQSGRNAKQGAKRGGKPGGQSGSQGAGAASAKGKGKRRG